MFLGMYTSTRSCIVKLPDEVRASHTKRLGENTRITTQEVRRSAAHWFILLELYSELVCISNTETLKQKY